MNMIIYADHIQVRKAVKVSLSNGAF